jgi:hypothetical protein
MKIALASKPAARGNPAHIRDPQAPARRWRAQRAFHFSD